MTMDKYTIYCTEEQTKKALELGAPIETGYNRFDNEDFSPLVQEDKRWLYAVIPTAEQMMGFLEDKTNLEINIINSINGCYDYFTYKGSIEVCNHGGVFASRKEATLAAIDAALKYLIEHNLIK